MHVWCYCSGVSSFNSFIHDYESNDDLYYESESESESEDSLAPSSPCSTTSFVSRASSFSRHRRHSGLCKRLLRSVFWPFRIWYLSFSIPIRLTNSIHHTYCLPSFLSSSTKKLGVR